VVLIIFEIEIAHTAGFVYILTSKTKGIHMNAVATTKMSSKGQVVIPEEVRSRLGFHSGSQFIVIGENDVIILKSIAPPSMKDFDSIIQRARGQAKAAGMKPSDVSAAIKKVRNRK
jgi:AbrB family looped-hinge helix DNA binding protein